MTDNQHASPPFEGPEKLLEIWFVPSAADVPDAETPDENGRTGLRKIPRQVWDDMLNIVRCKVLSVVEGAEMDAYLLSESSFFVSPHRLILKTCGTTLNLLGLPRILEIASTQASLHTVHRCFYSRKSFMFPDRQQGPHRDWKNEVEFLDNIFPGGAAYTVGKVNGDHWLLYMTSPVPISDVVEATSTEVPTPSIHIQDYTIEILMSDLAPSASQVFHCEDPTLDGETASSHAQKLSSDLGILDIFPRHLSVLDAYTFSPCGYSSNALIKWNVPQHQLITDIGNHPSPNPPVMQGGEGYYTIHVTPEEGWSYASFECNVPLSPRSASDATTNSETTFPDLTSLIQRVVKIFQPGRLSLTLFISSADNEGDGGESAIEEAQRAFKAALTGPGSFSLRSKGPGVDGIATNGIKKPLYRRTDKINYEFQGYDLAFASFELAKP
ncbi:hypothetical protein HGRIS_002234 [Hohenbuehelia grisea]|uniref:adenosylmethionine decarboxylase n=1 Tax=Hohenbuehelia grisea TaxID=104357 RepID=A0ABR3JLS4_9AGAR